MDDYFAASTSPAHVDPPLPQLPTRTPDSAKQVKDLTAAAAYLLLLFGLLVMTHQVTATTGCAAFAGCTLGMAVYTFGGPGLPILAVPWLPPSLPRLPLRIGPTPSADQIEAELADVVVPRRLRYEVQAIKTVSLVLALPLLPLVLIRRGLDYLM